MRGAIVMAVAGIVAAIGNAGAVQIRECDEVANVANILEPWDKNTRVFDKGQVRVAVISTTEPACCSNQFLILAPDPSDETGERSCHLVTNTNGAGFGDLAFEETTATYDPKTGLLIAFPYSAIGLDGQPKDKHIAHIRVNLSTGKVTAEK